LSKQTDEYIMLMVREGKVEMLAILFERYHVKLYNFLLRLTGKNSVSEDLVQEIFFRILKYRKTFQGKSKFTTWMFQVARNVHIDYLKKNRAESSLDDQWEEEESSLPGPNEKIEKEQEINLVQKAIALLPVRKREVILLSRFQDMKYKDIAEMQGSSIESVKVLAHRAIKDLRKNYINLKGGIA
jgi:RNA polymerase sigma-70 factor (family 1)